MHGTDVVVLEGGSRRKKRAKHVASAGGGRRAPQGYGRHATAGPNRGNGKAQVSKAKSGKRVKY
jgi:hypothetical protein